MKLIIITDDKQDIDYIIEFMKKDEKFQFKESLLTYEIIENDKKEKKTIKNLIFEIEQRLKEIRMRTHYNLS